MTTAHHDAAVQHLTDHQRFVRLVVQREIKGPLEPPLSPRSPLLKGLSPAGYLANRPSSTGYKRTMDGTLIVDESANRAPANAEHVTVAVHDSHNSTNGTIEQPVPAPRRLNSLGGTEPPVQNGTTAPQATGGAATATASTTTTTTAGGYKSEDDEAQV